MWMVDPKKMCRSHLLGEHKELHQLVGSLNKNKSINGHLDKGQVEVHNIRKRHKELVKEMKRRGYSHNSPLPKFKSFRAGKINIKENEKELKKRCKNCRTRQNSKITTIIFDVGGVQYFYDHMNAARAMEKETGISAKKIKKVLEGSAKNTKFWRMAELAPLEKEYWKQFSKELNISSVDSKKMSKLWNLIFTPNKPMLKLIKKLRKKYKLAILSNMSQGHKKWLISKGITKPFPKHNIIWSCDVNLRKPNKKIYNLVLKTINSKPEESVFVDDFLRNIKVARKVHECGIVYKDHKKFLNELKKLGVEW